MLTAWRPFIGSAWPYVGTLYLILGRETRRASLRGGSLRQSTSGVGSGSLPTSPRQSVRGPGEARSAILRGRGDRGSSFPARAELSLAQPRATDPTNRRQSGSRNTPRHLGRIETSGVAALQEKVPFSLAP